MLPAFGTADLLRAMCYKWSLPRMLDDPESRALGLAPLAHMSFSWQAGDKGWPGLRSTHLLTAIGGCGEPEAMGVVE